MEVFRINEADKEYWANSSPIIVITPFLFSTPHKMLDFGGREYAMDEWANTVIIEGVKGPVIIFIEPDKPFRMTKQRYYDMYEFHQPFDLQGLDF